MTNDSLPELIAFFFFSACSLWDDSLSVTYSNDVKLSGLGFTDLSKVVKRLDNMQNINCRTFFLHASAGNITDNGDGTYTVPQANVTDNGDGSYTVRMYRVSHSTNTKVTNIHSRHLCVAS